MSGNATADQAVRLYPDLLAACSATACEQCGGHLPDHDWADLGPDGTVVDCSEQAR